MPEWLTRYARPREGWLALGLLVVMLFSLSWSVQRAGWIDLTEFLIPVAFYAALLGAVLALTPLSVAAVLPIAALAGTGIVLWAVGGEYFPDLSQADRLSALRGESLDWIHIIVDRGYGPQLVPYALGFGVVMWVTGFIAAYAIYRHHRVLDAILLVGALMIANMSATLTDLFWYLVLFMVAALLLWLRAALIGREEGWQRRRVNENAEVPAAIMRSGIVFIAGSIMLAWVLTTVAVAAPLTAVWNSVNGVWSEVRDDLDGIFGGLANPQARIQGPTFGSFFKIDGSFVSSDAPVLTLAAPRAYYLRTATYERYTGWGFSRGGTDERRVAAGQFVFPDGSPEQPVNLEAFTLDTVTIQYQQPSEDVFVPGYPTAVLMPIKVLETGGLPILGGLEATRTIPAGEGYAVTALISQATKAQLNAAGTDYPEEIAAMYLPVETTTRVRELALDVVTTAGAETPFEMAEALAAFLRTDSRFRYAETAPVPDDPDADFVDFFLFDPNGRVGYCEYYATSMAVMARTLGLPARVATGYAPGSPISLPEGGRGAGVYQVRQENAHAWAEVYFPGYGWERFEATKTIAPVQRLTGEGVGPGQSAGPAPSIQPGGGLSPDDRGNSYVLPSFNPTDEGWSPEEAGPGPETRGGNLLVIVAIVGLAVAAAAWRLQRVRRRMRFLAPGERQWFRLALAADRAGIAQRPSETIYEYAGWLEEQIPRHRPEIRTIADGKVWQSYSGRGVSGGAIARMEAAWKKLQLPLLWLGLRRRLATFVPRLRRG